MPTYGPMIDEFERGSRVREVPVVVLEATRSTTKDEKPYGRYLLKDRSGTIEAIRWEHEVADDEGGAVALVAGTVEDYRGKPQLKMQDLLILRHPTSEVLERLTTAQDAGLLDRLVELMKHAQATLPAVFWRVFVDSLGHDPFDLDGPFWTYAAAQSKHHAGRGGLAWHVLTMFALADSVTPWYPKLDADVLKLAVLTHDLGKLDCYEMGAAGARQLSLDRTVGHSGYSVARVHTAIRRARERGEEFTVADEESLLHCIAAHHGRLEWGAMMEPQTPEASAMHAIDLLDSQARPSDDRNEPPPHRGAAATPADASPRRGPTPDDDPFVEETNGGPARDQDPFLVDDDDPFDEPAGSQQRLF